MSIRVETPTGTIKVAQPNTSFVKGELQPLEDDFVLQSPTSTGNPVHKPTEFVFECDMTGEDEHENIPASEGNNESSDQDTFIVGAANESETADNEQVSDNSAVEVQVQETGTEAINPDNDNFTVNRPVQPAVQEALKSELENVRDEVINIASQSDTPVVTAHQQTAKPNGPRPYVPSIVDITKAISKVSNFIRDLAKERDVYNYIDDKRMPAQDFYAKLSNSIWKSLLQFCNIVQYDTPNSFDIPTISADTPYIETWTFFDKIYHDTRVSFEKDPLTSITRYKKVFRVDGGISSDWIPLLINKLLEKTDISENDAIKVADAIYDDWCYAEYHESGNDDDNTSENVPVDDQSIEATETVNVSVPVMQFDEVNSNGRVYESNGNADTSSPVVFTGDMSDIIDNDVKEQHVCDDDCDCDDDDDDDDDEDSEVLSIDIQKDEGIIESIVSITAWNGTSMMLYVDLENIDVSVTQHPNQWNWLRHFIPNALVLTDNPDMFLEYNDSFTAMKFVQLAMTKDVTKDETDSSTIIGIYYIDDDIDNLGENFIRKINILVENNTAGSPNLSHLVRTLQMDKLIVDEEKILACIDMTDDDDDDQEDESNQSGDTMEDMSDFAAQVALANANGNNTVDAEVSLTTVGTPSDDQDNQDDNQEDSDETNANDYEAATSETGYPAKRNSKHKNNKGRPDDELTFAPIRKGNKSSKYKDI